jgi:5-bromo-4-chloroindolyl phosphate hydrolysis protein
MLTQNMYDLYAGALRSREEQEREEEQKYAGVDGSVRRIIEEGNRYKEKIRQANDDIADEAMSSKLAALESIMNRIFKQVQAKPETAPRLRKLMNYYLPTTTKLLDAYIELDRQDEPGENVRTTKREIESALDTINKAFENLLDSMFQDMAWDISSDISVMKSMLDQDGLTERELRAGGKPEEKEEKKEEEGQVQQLVF